MEPDSVVIRARVRLDPLPADYVPRRRLTDALSGPGMAVATIIAPAGYGKSALVSEWRNTAHFDDRTMAAIRLDARDNDPARFWHLIREATATLGSPVAPALEELLRDELRLNPDAPPESTISAVIEGLEAAPGRGALVIDDLHTITNPAIREGMRLLIPELPSTVQLVLISRSSIPDFGLHRLTSRSALVQISSAELAFTEPEAAQLLVGAAHGSIPAPDVAGLVTSTEGWVTGLRFAALPSATGPGQHPPTGAGREGYGRAVASFLSEEVVSNQPAERLDFLVDVCVLDELTGPACDEVSGREGSLSILRELEEHGSFVSSLDPERLRFRLQPVFRELLFDLLAAEPAARQSRTHSRASRWYESRGSLSLAIDHALAAGEVHRAAGLIIPLVSDLHRRGLDLTLRRWLAQIPDDVVAARPLLALKRAWIFAYADEPPNALQWCQRADATAELDSSGDSSDVLAESACLRAIAYRALGDLASAREWGEIALTRLDVRDPTRRYDDSYARLAMVDALAEVYGLSGEPERGLELLRSNIERTRDGANVFAAVALPGKMASMCTDLGVLDDVARHVDRALTESARFGLTGKAPEADAQVAHGELLWERNDLASSARAFQAGVDAAAASRSVWIRGRALVGLARCRSAQGQFAEAGVILDTAESVYPWGPTPEFWSEQLAGSRILLAIRRHDSADAHSWLARLSSTAGESRRTSYLTAVVALSEGRVDDAEAAAARCSPDAGNRRWSLALAMLAFRLSAARSSDQAHDALLLALTLGAQGGFVRTIIGPDPAAILAGIPALGDEVDQDYVRTIESAARQELSQTTDLPGASSRAVPNDRFTEGELAVIRFLPTDLSYAEIAARRFVSVNTVKTQLSSIYRKLAVTTRAGAAERSRRLGLLP